MFEYGSMSVIIFTPRGNDYQTRHSRDELYIVIKGSGTLMIADTPHTFGEEMFSSFWPRRSIVL